MAKHKSNNRIFFWLGGIVVVLLLVALLGRQQGWLGQSDAKEVTMAPVRRGDLVEMVSASGKVQPEVEVILSPDVPGEIVELHVAEGDSVTQGQLLLKIRPDNFISVLDRSQAAVNTNRATLAQARATLAQSEARLARAQANYERNRDLYNEKVIPQAEFETIEAEYTVAQKEVEAARQNIEASRFSVQSAQASVDEARENLRRTRIDAPMSGIVSKLSVEKGERVVGTSQMAGTELMRIADLRQMEVRVEVNENDIVRVQIGDTADIEVDSYARAGEKFLGVVTAIANTAKEALTTDVVTEFEVKVRILSSSYQSLLTERRRFPFRPGMTASVDIITERKQDIVMVPLAAVTTRSAREEDDAPRSRQGSGEAQAASQNDAPISRQELQEVVFVVKADQTVEKRVVTTGISDFEYIEVVSGLEPGERVVSGPFLAVSRQLRDGDLVREAEGRATRRADRP